jgi:hypothetical protein
MKFAIFLTCCILSVQLQAQSLKGKKIFTSTITTFDISFSKSKAESTAQPTQTTKNSSFNLLPEITYGKINSKNVLIAYGLALRFGKLIQLPPNQPKFTITTYGLYPTLLGEKFISITEKIYFSPLAKFRIGYGRTTQSNLPGKTSLYEGNFTFQPFSLTINVKPKTNVIFLLGAINATYLISEYKNQSGSLDEKLITSSFSFSGTINNIGLGIQKIF